jgi:hypothetical protein
MARRKDIEMASSPDLATLSIDDFVPHLDAVFGTQIPDGLLPLKLAGAVAGGQSGRTGGAFSLLFVAPAGPWQKQAIYPVKHPVLGMMEIFLVPIGPLQGGNGYQAIFA